MKVTMKNEALPKGRELHVRGLGTLINGETVEFSKEQVEQFEALTGKKLPEAFENNPSITVGSATPAKGGDD